MSVNQPTSDTIRITWESEIGRTYQVQFKNTLIEDWANLQDGAVTATSNASTYTASITGTVQRFYRVIRLP